MLFWLFSDVLWGAFDHFFKGSKVLISPLCRWSHHSLDMPVDCNPWFAFPRDLFDGRINTRPRHNTITLRALFAISLRHTSGVQAACLVLASHLPLRQAWRKPTRTAAPACPQSEAFIICMCNRCPLNRVCVCVHMCICVSLRVRVSSTRHALLSLTTSFACRFTIFFRKTRLCDTGLVVKSHDVLCKLKL